MRLFKGACGAREGIAPTSSEMRHPKKSGSEVARRSVRLQDGAAGYAAGLES